MQFVAHWAEWWPCVAMWCHRTGSTLAQVMVCCLTAPIHYLNQYRLIALGEVSWLSSEGKLTWKVQDLYSWLAVENYQFRTITIFLLAQWVNSSWPCDATWRHKPGSTLVQTMACCLTPPSHYLNQCWLTIRKVQWHSSEDNFTRYTPATNH